MDEKVLYGYETIEIQRKRSENVFELKADTLYPLLHGMEEKGYLEILKKQIRCKKALPLAPQY